MNPNIIFIAGVHGVGKGMVSNILSSEFKLHNYSASDLIKKEKNAPVAEGKIVQGATENQDYLVQAIDKLDHENLILLDGHFVLKARDGFFEVPISTFESLSIIGVLLLTGTGNFIENNLRGRDGEAFSLSEIERLQHREVARAEEVCSKLGFELFTVDSRNHNEIRKLVKGIKS